MSDAAEPAITAEDLEAEEEEVRSTIAAELNNRGRRAMEEVDILVAAVLRELPAYLRDTPAKEALHMLSSRKDHAQKESYLQTRSAELEKLELAIRSMSQNLEPMPCEQKSALLSKLSADCNELCRPDAGHH
eukprot:TRINITY_DN21289_c0_g1_i3.p1 TRINITY_DN21289_c0_g1~~TRINITY_DN21289_c0_g1_i3.p1  ORF type:complete len:141 (+),score=35.88 TRINITY_DN21289_c0_g1_i3:30-425(+)